MRHVPALMIPQLVLNNVGTTPVNRPALLLGCILSATWGLASSAAAADPTTLSALMEQGGLLYNFLVALLTAGYQRAPALVLVLGALLVVPVVAVLSLLLQSGLRAFLRWHAINAIRSSADAPARADDAAHRRTAGAWLSIEGGASPALPLAAPMVCIGRHEDNDIRLPDRSVHRYHAVIHRTEDDFVITDLSGEDGNGVRVNGRRQVQTRLANGDRIEIGRARLTFAAIPV
jgi:hypothetical protein